MAGTITVETLAQALALFEAIGMPARALAFRPHREYSHDLLDLFSYLTREGQALCFSSNCRVVRNGEERVGECSTLTGSESWGLPHSSTRS